MIRSLEKKFSQVPIKRQAQMYWVCWSIKAMTWKLLIIEQFICNSPNIDRINETMKNTYVSVTDKRVRLLCHCYFCAVINIANLDGFINRMAGCNKKKYIPSKIIWTNISVHWRTFLWIVKISENFFSIFRASHWRNSIATAIGTSQRTKTIFWIL